METRDQLGDRIHEHPFSASRQLVGAGSHVGIALPAASAPLPLFCPLPYLTSHCSPPQAPSLATVSCWVRAHLEQSFHRRFKIPVVMIAVEGGENTLVSLEEALDCETPVVVVRDSGRACTVVGGAIDAIHHARERGGEMHDDQRQPSPAFISARQPSACRFENDLEFRVACGEWIGDNRVDILLSALQRVFLSWKKEVEGLTEEDLKHVQRIIMAEFPMLVGKSTDHCKVAGASAEEWNGIYKLDLYRRQDEDDAPVFKKIENDAAKAERSKGQRKGGASHQLYYRDGHWALGREKGETVYRVRADLGTAMSGPPRTGWFACTHAAGAALNAASPQKHAAQDPALEVVFTPGLGKALKLWEALAKVAHPLNRNRINVYSPEAQVLSPVADK
ncbi:hypothetical protein CYMTET_29055 [Cymbomonas tetramitiformis]|uniref:TRPM SLOG domain-containing protein n=1 Tax=Cymbomonas tetramitiformis TaxID=36881 RepID=A0AAE0FLL3_9CHLO|nr:hypothetical protein CYMTET_29055 [Cymbomonas tetramitiformis]